MAQSIETRYIGPTDSHGARARATAHATGQSLSLPWDYALNDHRNHESAARALAGLLRWFGPWAGTGTRDGFTFVHINSALTFTIEEPRA